MLYVDYSWDLEPNRIKFDKELDLDRLGWRHGDCFKIINIDGQAMLVKVDPVEQFFKGQRVNNNE